MPDFHPVYFGVDVEAVMSRFFHEILVPEVIERYGNTPFALVVLSNRVQHDWTNPFGGNSILLRFSYGDDEKVNGEQGLFANVAHKLHYVLRTGMNSSYAVDEVGRLEPGDFPYAGAGTVADFIGGVSGFSQEEDWAVYERFTCELYDVRAVAARAAVEESKARVPGMKYLGGVPAQPGIYVPS